MSVLPFARPPGPSSPSLVFYVSGHGFGHASRDIEILNALHAARPDLHVTVRTTAARWLFEASLDGPIAYQEVACDTGVAQIDSLRLDEGETVRRAARFYDALETHVAREVAALRAVRADLVVGDIPPLASAAAAAAGLPAILIGNFTWDWIYEGYADSLTGAPHLLSIVRQAYAGAACALRLPMSGGFAPVMSVTKDIPLVARHARQAPADVRRRLALPDDRPIVLVSFGGHGLKDFDPAPLGRHQDFTFLTTGARSDRPPSNVVEIDAQTLYRDGLRYEDLVGAADVVVTKPGYGIVAEAIANGTSILYTSRGRFVEYDVLVEAMHRLTRCRYIPNSDLLAGHWAGHLERLLDLPAPAVRPPTNGAGIAAREILDRL
ncbi:MAG TPA: hypothetical protein VNE16_17090 [Vicinamibacterales bacterium]|nr:hypothetical protein [Vicinamibacterales bacterium]